jgi:hypothetical protein
MVSDFDRLLEILDSMDVPELRKRDMQWLQRNLGVRNRAHPDFEEAMRLIRSNA